MNSKNSKTVIVGGVLLVAIAFWQWRSSKSPANVVEAPEVVASTTQTRALASKETSEAQANTSAPVPQNQQDLVQLIRDTKECFTSETCDFPNTDPKSYEIAVGHKLKDLLKLYHNEYGKDPRYKEDTENLAREFITLDDQFVQEVSLDILSDVAPSTENLKALTTGLHETLDPLLVEQAMNEMKRYLGTSDEPQVHEFLQELLGNGSVFSSEKAVQGVFAFINPQSYPGYEKIARSLPPESSVGKDLRALLEEYRRLQAGG